MTDAAGLLPVFADHAEAVISECGRYRYWLRRRLGKSDLRKVVFCMLNPSTADATDDDPTIRRCLRFAKTWGFDELIVVNLFAFRATQPTELFNETLADPVGPDNHAWVSKAAGIAAELENDIPRNLFVCAWGHHGGFMRQDRTVLDWIGGANPHALKITKHGHPQHPLYLKGDCRPFPWDGRT